MLSTLTAAQQQAVVSAGPLIVSASAGSGKTRVLVERYVRLLLEGYDVRRIVAMTFTRKAAAEMLDRVARRLEQLFARAQNAEELLFLRTVRERLVNAQISTFHSYCSSLLRRFPIEAGIPPSLVNSALPSGGSFSVIPSEQPSKNGSQANAGSNLQTLLRHPVPMAHSKR